MTSNNDFYQKLYQTKIKFMFFLYVLWVLLDDHDYDISIFSRQGDKGVIQPAPWFSSKVEHWKSVSPLRANHSFVDRLLWDVITLYTD